jgi:non-heme chloroperoxidase
MSPPPEPQGPRSEPPAAEGPARRLTGLANLLGALRNLGLLGRRHGGDAPGLMRYVADDGQAIPVHLSGQGPPVVLVHGLGCSHRHWMPVARHLARRHRVFAWDARGHGQCRTEPDAPITLARLARDLYQLMDHFQLDRVTLVGHSMGALTVMQYLSQFGTARVAAVAVVDQSPRIVTDEQWRLGLFGACSADTLGNLIAGARTNLTETVLHQIEAVAGDWLRPRLAADAPLGRILRRWLNHVEVMPLLDLAESLAAADFRGLMPALDLPLLVVLGARSPHYAGLPLDAWYREAVPHARISVYPRAGHSPHYTEPARFARELMAMTAGAGALPATLR